MLPASPVVADDEPEAAAQPIARAQDPTFLAKPYLQTGRAPTPDSLQLL